MTSHSLSPNGAIQTRYAGHLFRSRLEARWAVFFDSLGVEWKYEHQGYEAQGMKYLPDFYLPESNSFVEVKGDRMGVFNDYDRMSVMLGEDSPLPGFINGDSFVILLGEVENFVDGETMFHPCLHRRSKANLRRDWVGFGKFRNTSGPFLVESSILSNIIGLGSEIIINSDHAYSGFLVETRFVPSVMYCAKARSAYQEARSARFEYGQSGALKNYG